MGRLALAVAVVAAGLAGPVQSHAETTVKLGVLNDRSGPFSDASGEGSVIAARMAVEDFGAEAKGIHVEIVSGDHLNKPDIGSSIVRRWYDQEGVDVVLDVPISSIALAVGTLTRERNKILLTSSSGASEMTGAQCSPNTIQWTYDTWSLANGTARTLVKLGGKTWFFITSDIAFGYSLEHDTTVAIEKAGGKVLGDVKSPPYSTDVSSYLLAAQGSGANVIGLANGTAEARLSVSDGRQFGIQQAGQKFASLLMVINDAKVLGLESGQGLVLTEPFYWDLNDRTRAFSARFAAQVGGREPSMFQAGVYSAVLHYLKAVAAAGTKDTAEVLAKMKSMPTDDDALGQGYVRADGRKIHNMYVFEMKRPDESKGPWDLYKVIATIPGDEAFRPMAEGGCPFVNAAAAAAK